MINIINMVISIKYQYYYRHHRSIHSQDAAKAPNFPSKSHAYLPSPSQRQKCTCSTFIFYFLALAVCKEAYKTFYDYCTHLVSLTNMWA